MGQRLKAVARGLALAIGACAFAAEAGSETDADAPLAERFWVDWEELASAERRRHPAWCSGAYRFPQPQQAQPGDSKVKAASDSATYLADGTVELGGGVVITQGARQVRTDRALINPDADTATAPRHRADQRCRRHDAGRLRRSAPGQPGGPS